MPSLQATYILPLKSRDANGLEALARYLQGLPVAQIVVVDSSSQGLFDSLQARLPDPIEHIRPDIDIAGSNGKARNVLTGLRRARFEYVVLADDDVRYDESSLADVVKALGGSDVVRPQNYFSPLPWHAIVDTGRILLNRALDGDWPGTLALRRSMLPRGYNADVLFENFELVRTIKARGGRELLARGLYVRRIPATAGHFWSQRTRQAYDEFARPARLVFALSLLPLTAYACIFRQWSVPLAIVAATLTIAALGWVRDGGIRYFPLLAVAAAPLWLFERACCSWLALYERLRFGGARYAGGVIRCAASNRKELRRWAA
jgi:glycosyltransferase involved in cell wall biosynthesis